MTVLWELNLHTNKQFWDTMTKLTELAWILSAVGAIRALWHKELQTKIGQLGYVVGMSVWTLILTWTYGFLGWVLWRTYFFFFS